MNKVWPIFMLLIGGLILISCSAGGGGKCTSGTEKDCFCEGEQTGTKICVDKKWTECSCNPSDTGIETHSEEGDTNDPQDSDQGDTVSPDTFDEPENPDTYDTYDTVDDTYDTNNPDTYDTFNPDTYDEPDDLDTRDTNQPDTYDEPDDPDTRDTDRPDTHDEPDDPDTRDTDQPDTTDTFEIIDTETPDTRDTRDTQPQEPEIDECSSIEEVRDAPDGPTDLLLCDVIVTYIYHSGYFLQIDRQGPAIRVYKGPEWNQDVMIGERLSLRVTRVTTYHDNKEIVEHDPIHDTSLGHDVLSLYQNLSTGILPRENMLDEVVAVHNLEVTNIDDQNLFVSYGTANEVLLRVSDASDLCIGVTFDLFGVVTAWDGDFRLESMESADLKEVDSSGCMRPPNQGELLINEFLADPPEEGDANCDGIRDGRNDEFIEIVNVSNESLDLSGVTVSDENSVRFTFPDGSSINPGKVAVIFGGGEPDCTIWTSDVQVFASYLALNNDGDTISISDNTDNIISQVTYTEEDIDGQSLTLDPDMNRFENYSLHSEAHNSGGDLFSPGTCIDGDPFPCF